MLKELLTALSQSKHLMTVLSVLHENSMFCEPMFVVKASETPTVEDPLNTVLGGTQSISILLFTG